MSGIPAKQATCPNCGATNHNVAGLGGSHCIRCWRVLLGVEWKDATLPMSKAAPTKNARPLDTTHVHGAQ